MLRFPAEDRPQDIAFLLLPRFSLIGLLSAIEPLRGANRTLGFTAYTWQFLSIDGRPVESSNGIPIAAAKAGTEPGSLPAVCIVASYDPMAVVGQDLLHWLRRLHHQGSDIGAFETGTFILAAAGLLGGRRVTVHWETLEAFREAYLDIDARDSLFEIDEPFFTCSGGTASMDLMLHLVARHHSVEVANSVAEQFLHSEIRDPAAHQRMAADRRAGVYNPELVRITEIMAENMETPLEIHELAARCGLGKRQLERLFARIMDTPPYRYYLRLRLERARHLVRYSHLPLNEVAVACGFGSAASFSRAYRAHFGQTPRSERGPKSCRAADA